MIKSLALFTIFTISAHAQVINPAVTQGNIRQTICISGWTKTVRPPVSYTNQIKRNLMQKQGLPMASISDYELDHRIPIEVGGHPRDQKNLWLQAWDGPDGAHAKDVIETRTKRLVCTGHITLAQGQACLSKDWHSCPR